ncbi:Ger(x)C family spore germination protein [Cohnella sp. JJ-181]|uniref:Ger(x)C family spore germination protein n=1 Tax=Cohnella rhizoplanae TaxID=2974897 RepID=UPI0022FF9AE5|nr:Ger(x)C family spore germination protein [Cohnella sp. JJ-181]CAI6084985.1 Spore germination protein B3 [Cohnella sp. JJ-181]
MTKTFLSALWVPLLAFAMAGCSPDTTEIGDIALVTAIGIDYDKENHQFTFSSYSIMPMAGGADQPGRLSQWVARSNGGSILESARNLKSQAGKTLIWVHNKFIIVGEEAARHSFSEIMDFLTRNRQIRMSSYLIVSEGKAADQLRAKVGTGDMLSNDLLGKIRNENAWGKNVAIPLHDIADRYGSPDRGFITGKIKTVFDGDMQGQKAELKGAAVFNRGRLAGWIEGDDVLVYRLLSDKQLWNSLEFDKTVRYERAAMTFLVRESKHSVRTSFRRGVPVVDIYLKFSASIGEIDRTLPLQDPSVIKQMERLVSKELEKMMDTSLHHYQREVKVDILGWADLFAAHHPRQWEKIKADWSTVYPAVKANVTVDVKIEKLGLIRVLKD